MRRQVVVIMLTHRNTWLHTATHCNTLQHRNSTRRQIVACTALATPFHCISLQFTATQCNTLQHTATHCNTLQHTTTQEICASADRCMRSSGYAISLQHTAIHCNTLQRTATHCNTLQHTATQEICASADRRMRSSGYANSPPTHTLVTRPYIPDPEPRYKLFASTTPVCCSVLQCSLLQPVAVLQTPCLVGAGVLQCVALCCSVKGKSEFVT